MPVLKNIFSGEKITERARQTTHPITQKIIETVSTMDYDLWVHQDKKFLPLPIFTLILTIYDANIQYIEESLRSAFSQTYENTEVILINNGAPGKVNGLIWYYFLNHKNAKLIETKKHLYNPAASLLKDPIPHLWNAGLFCSVGDFVYFLSYDDFISLDYAEKMVQLFLQNEKCRTAAPAVALVNELSTINVEETEHMKSCSQREKYTDGIALAKNYMGGGNNIGFPGGLLAVKTTVALENGGFDKNNDLSQLFKFAVCGDSGFDPSATLYWRHHPNQAHKMQRKLGLIYYRNIKEFNRIYNMKKFHQAVCGIDFANQYEHYMDKFLEEHVIQEFYNIYTVSFLCGLKALCRIFMECPFKIQLAALRPYIKYFPKYFNRFSIIRALQQKFFSNL